MKPEDTPDVAGVVAFPPLIYGIPLVASLALNHFVLRKRLPPAASLLGIGFLGAAASLMLPSFARMKAAGTNIDPFAETTAIVETGPFAHSRNPIYLGVTLAYAGIALAARSPFSLTLLPAILYVMNEGVIVREERYLDRKFGESYRAYKARVPRWI